MASIHFTFAAGVDGDERRRALDEMRSWGGIATASQLKPESRHPVTSRLAYVILNDDADVKELIARIGALPGIETVSIPSRRGIAR